jgi:glycosyltransferase involved in cell wall biosynthesis
MVARKRLYVIWYASLGEGLSGGDNILVELCKRWQKKLNICIYTGTQGKNIGEKHHPQVFYKVCPTKWKYFRYLERLYYSLKTAFTFKDSDSIVYTASDFPHDLLVGWIIKLRFPSIKWISGYYLVICPPFASTSPYKGLLRVRGLGYWLMQRFTLFIVNKWTDLVYVTSIPEQKHFTVPTVVIRGGVDLKRIDDYIDNENKVFVPFKYAKYEAVFMGRLHYQKGIIELMEIWKMVNEVLPEAKLLVIGDGPLRKQAQQIAPLSVIFVGYQHDEAKYELLCDSKIILHPATYDSGGMACAEGMAFGMPAVGFDLEVFKTYYPYGMLKARNKEHFAQLIVSLLTNEKLYTKISLEARHLIVTGWDWDKRQEIIWKQSGLS